MRAQLKSVNDVSIVYLSGKMNLDSAEEFQEICLKAKFSKLLIGLNDLSFVGSTGITILLQSLRILQSKSMYPLKFFGVSSEFQRIFAANLENFQIFENENQAYSSFYPPQPVQPAAYPQHQVSGATHSPVFGMSQPVGENMTNQATTNTETESTTYVQQPVNRTITNE